MNLYETLVPKKREGRGVGKLLANEAFEHCRKGQIRMRLSCWYLAGYLQRHPREEWSSLVVK